MNQQATPGTNRTGVAAAPQQSEEMLAGMEEFPPSSQGSAEDLAQVRIVYAQAAEPLGSVPPPAEVKGKKKSAAKAAKGAPLRLLMDKLGERLAFERTGTRLYDALVSKHEAFGSFAAGRAGTISSTSGTKSSSIVPCYTPSSPSSAAIPRP